MATRNRKNGKDGRDRHTQTGWCLSKDHKARVPGRRRDGAVESGRCPVLADVSEISMAGELLGWAVA